MIIGIGIGIRGVHPRRSLPTRRLIQLVVTRMVGMIIRLGELGDGEVGSAMSGSGKGDVGSAKIGRTAGEEEKKNRIHGEGSCRYPCKVARGGNRRVVLQGARGGGQFSKYLLNCFHTPRWWS